MKSPRRKLAAILLGVLLLAVLRVWFGSTPSKLKIQVPALAGTADVVTASRPAQSISNLAAPSYPLPDLFATAAKLRMAESSQASREQLRRLRQALSLLPPGQASAVICQFLESKADAPTGQSFKIGGKGWLDSAPTLRVFLLDYLSRVDPAGAADYARVVLSNMDSPDEWAVALRNLATGDSSTDGRALLEQKLGEMLHNKGWQQDPSVGFLESFDAAVYLGGTNLVPTLSELVRLQDNPAAAHAAFLALDRLVINDPARLLASLEADPGLMQGRELTRANYFARADVHDPQQRQLLENYLLDPRFGPAEMNQFAGLFPNGNYMISQNLLTPLPAPDATSLVSRDIESLRAVEDWLADPRFVRLQPQLQIVQTRLQGFVSQAANK